MSYSEITLIYEEKKKREVVVVGREGGGGVVGNWERRFGKIEEEMSCALS